MFKNRKDAVWVKPKDSVQAIVPFLMDKRCDAEVSYNLKMDITELCNWVDDLNESGKLEYKMTYFHAIISAFAMTVYNREMLNYFVKNKRLYKRKNVNIAFVAKNKFEDDAEERLITLDLDPKDNAISLSHKLAIDVFKVRSVGTNSMDNVLKVVTSLPKPLLTLVFNLVKFLDNHGWNPKFLTEGDTNYSTILFSNLGSIKANACYHHLNNYGTNSIMITIGTISSSKKNREVDVQVTFDERIADGFYFAKSISLAEYIMANPHLLEDSLSTKIEL